MGLHILFHSLGWEDNICGNQCSATVLREWGRGWAKLRQHAVKKKWICLLLWERQHVLDYELPASFLYKLVSLSMGAADCSMATPGPMLLFCQDLTSLDYHHNIHQLSSTQPPLPPLPTPFSPILPLPILCPQSDPSSWILSEWHPLNLPNYLSSGHSALGCTFLSQGGATGSKALQLDFLTTHQKRHTLVTPSTLHCQVQKPGLQVKERWYHLELWVKNCLQGLEPRSSLAH